MTREEVAAELDTAILVAFYDKCCGFSRLLNTKSLVRADPHVNHP